MGPPEHCDAARIIGALGSLLPPPPPRAPGPFALSAPGALEELVRRAGLIPGRVAESRTRWEYPDRETTLRADLSSGPAAKAIQAVGTTGSPQP